MDCVNGFTVKFVPVAVFVPFVQLYVYVGFGPATSKCALVFSHSLTVGVTKAIFGSAFTVKVFADVLVQVPKLDITLTLYVPDVLVIVLGTVNGFVFMIVCPLIFQS